MCGIAGIYNYADPSRPVDRPLLERMTRALAHRGPDGEGFFVEGPIGFGHRRLAIVELSPLGAQPMEGSQGVLTYNGELYNHLQLRDGEYRGHSDTETLLRHLEASRPLEALSGIFAFAYWNRAAKALLLARDQLGVKQLYYFDDGQRLLFASEMKALLQCASMPRELDPEALNQYLHFHTPLFERTFLRAVRQLLPGEQITVDRGGRKHSRYFRIEEFGGGPADAQAIEALRAELSLVVGDQLMSDVPVGAFFSGGIDSTAAAAFAVRNGQRPTCFGVHFSDSGVIDERPFQEAAAKALGLELQLTTYDSRRFPQDLPKLLFQQDQPVIGAAMFPMWEVARLAGSQVKVCLGGQGADEIFGGYARYALVHPLRVARGMMRSRGGNLSAAAKEPKTLRRILTSARNLTDWREAYFGNFAAVPEEGWRELIEGEAVSRESCRAQFRDFVARSPALDPADKVMHWDALTYLPGLFHQDDRMSMAHGLESRVPLADKRLVQFAFRCRFDQKFRGGASKWLLRQAVADVLPPEVLHRRKVGFDTPAEAWLRGPHLGFVRETLLSSKARGLWKPKALEALLDNQNAPHWFARVWKVLCVESWSQVFQAPVRDSVPEVSAPDEPKLSALLQEVREIGASSAVFRARWELENRSGLLAARDAIAAAPPPGPLTFLPLPKPPALDGLYDAPALARLESLALQAGRGRILAFGHLPLDCGDPIDWHRDALTGRHWPRDVHWSRAMSARNGDIKIAWEPARFAHFYAMVRAAVLLPGRRSELQEAMASQVRRFIAENAFPRGIHWGSGQEIALRLISWLFAATSLQDERLAPPQAIAQGALHLERHFEFVSRSVSNNHLISEAVGLLVAALALPLHPKALTWRALAMETLTKQASRQIAPDGSSLQDSHNYQRVVLDAYVFAAALVRAPAEWTSAIERATRFLAAHEQANGRLPNFGANDGSRFLPLSQCAFEDFRPSLQAAAAAREERLYESGPWDEQALWLFGAAERRLRRQPLESVSFERGHHILRADDTMVTFRCGTVRERYADLDQLHVGLTYKGVEIAADGGAYCYADERMYRHLHGTESHNTVQVDGREQMVRQRRFSSVFRTRAELTRFANDSVAGEHSGYERLGVIHSREVHLKGDVCAVVDRLTGQGEHDLRLQWLCTPYPYEELPDGLLLQTPAGPYSLRVHGHAGDVRAGSLLPVRGWISRRYLERAAAPSLVVRLRATLPAVLVTILAPGRPEVEVRGKLWQAGPLSFEVP
ncbi:MAG TPA: asparagine synthase (glutamine-hydrolyzing) [Myxococcales bacterium]|nr:asparagine synthase (glutamine-hydrolyzing) [Myxococcales bacterium]